MGFVDESIVVGADVHDAYSLWLDYEGYPRFMAGIEAVHVVGYCLLRWRGRSAGTSLEWETDVVDRVEDTRVRWRATDGRETGDVDFQKLDARRDARPLPARVPAGGCGASTRRVVRACLHARVRGDLLSFKRLVEAQARAAAVDERPA